MCFNLADACGTKLAGKSSLDREKRVTDECPISETALDCCSPESFSCLVAPLCFFLITSRSFTKARLPVGVRPLGAERLREKKSVLERSLSFPSYEADEAGNVEVSTTRSCLFY